VHNQGRGMMLRRGPGLRDDSGAHRTATASRQTEAKRWLRGLFLVGSMLYLAGCGGGSSGTGETESNGQVVDPACTPVASVDLAAVGLPTVEESSAPDGTFTVDPEAVGDGTIPWGESAEGAGNSTEPTCSLVVYAEGMILAIDTYPAELLEECSVEGLREKLPEAAAALCGGDRAVEP